MAGICVGIIGESEAAAVVASAPAPAPAAAQVAEPISRASRRRRLELRPNLKVVADASGLNNSRKRQKLDLLVAPVPPSSESSPRACNNAVALSCEANEQIEKSHKKSNEKLDSNYQSANRSSDSVVKFGVTCVCGRRRDMEDAVSIQTSLIDSTVSFFGVFDGHGCSHVAMKCRERLHEIVKEETERRHEEEKWKEAMERSFARMDKEVEDWCSDINGDATATNAAAAGCRCELRTPQCDAVGSTAVVALLTQDKIVVSNCGDSRAVLCRNGVAIPLSSDHKPDRPDELLRIEAAGGRVIYWDGARVLGVLAMSRAIGDNYLKPYVISEPEVTVTERHPDDECLILASDGLWDVVPNETACSVSRMCLRAERASTPSPPPPGSPGNVTDTAASSGGSVESSNKACSDASVLLTKLALARNSTDNISVVVVDLRSNTQRQLPSISR